MDNRNLPLNHAAFDDALDNERSAYWAGFLAADGWVCRKHEYGTPKIGLTISEKDLAHLIEFRDFMGRPEAKISFKNPSGYGKNSQNRICTFSFSSQQAGATLATYGVVPRKSLTAKFARLLDVPAFWRGVICGDGSVGYKRIAGHSYPYISLTGSRDCLEQFVSFCSRNGVAKWTKFWQRPKSRAWYTCITGTKALIVIRCLFSTATVGLLRKRESAKHILDNWVGEPRTDRSYITASFVDSEFNRLGSWGETAKSLGVSVWNLHRRRKKLGLIPDSTH